MAKKTTKIEIYVSEKAEKKARQIFMAFFKITDSVLESKLCALYYIKEMSKKTKNDKIPFLDEIRRSILSGIKMGENKINI